MGDLYPAYLCLAEREVLGVGGGAVALRKVFPLLRAGARVTMVAPKVKPCEGLSDPRGARKRSRSQGSKPRLKILRRRYRSTDLKGKWLVIAATDCAQVNQRVSEDAAREKIFCNVVDQPELCTFQVPAVARRGLLKIAVSTSGASPALARIIRRRLEKEYGPPYARLLSALLGLRRHFQRKYPDNGARRRRLLEAFLKSPAPALVLKRGDPEAFRREVRQWKER
jgi:precorrin-2 dehydrogenase/sirohydrochlorin ferrochelatase